MRFGGPGPGPFRHGWGTPFSGFTVPCILLLLRRGPLHGYALRDELASSGLIPEVDFGNLYRALRRMEVAGLVSSRWDADGDGSGRRVYTLAPAGSSYLDAIVPDLRAVREAVGRFLTLYAGRG